MHTQQLRAPQLGMSDMTVTLQGEESKPANCFKLNGSGSIEEGITLEIDHPRVGGKPALFVGNYFILRNNSFGAAFDRNGTVRRAIVEFKQREGKRPLELLSQPTNARPPLLLHVDTTLRAGVKAKRNFWSGVDTDEKIVVQNGNESLIEFGDDGSCDVFYSDGTVVHVVRIAGQLATIRLSIEEQAKRRIMIANWLIDTAEDEKFSGLSYAMRGRRKEIGYRELIAIMAIGGKQDHAIHSRLFDLFADHGRQGRMPRNLIDEVRELIEIHPSTTSKELMGFDDAMLASRFSYTAEFSFGPLDGDYGTRGVPSSRRKYLAERAIRDNTARTAMRGSSDDKCLGKTGSKKK